VDNQDQELLDKIINLIDPDPEVGIYIAQYILTNSDKINAFLEKHDLDEVLFFPIGTIFYLINLNDDSRKETQRFKDNKFQIKYMKQNITLMQLNADDELKKLLNIDEEMIEKLISRNQEILDLPKPTRYNDKSIIKEKLENVFYYLQKTGKGQTDQINIILDLFSQEGFEDYAGGWTEDRFDKIRKGYQEPAIKKFRKLYGK
tara:strand:+ start:105 stop:713 length:609 start_codon:yes stop_codon:yes gene_type:complete